MQSIVYIACDLADDETLADFGRRENPRPVKRRWRIIGAGTLVR